MSGIFSIMAFIAILVVTINTNKDRLKQISTWRNIGIILSFFITITVATLLIYYGGNWFVGFIPNDFIQNIVFFIIVVLLISLLSTGLNKTIQKIVNGAIKDE